MHNLDVLKVTEVASWAIAVCKKLMGKYNIGSFLIYQSLRQWPNDRIWTWNDKFFAVMSLGG